mgnify:CR=1 FL=1
MQEKYNISLESLIREFALEPLTLPTEASEIQITSNEVNRPVLPLIGFFETFDAERIQIFGKGEVRFLNERPREAVEKAMDAFFATHPATVVVTSSLELPANMLACAEKYDVPLLRTAERTSEFMAALIAYLNVMLAPRITRHGVLVEVYGEGVLILGDSGVGKSETAIELVKRGHRLIADDAVEIRKVSSRQLVGNAPEVLRHYIELRGIGVINVAKLFGMGAVKDSCNIDLIINMVPWRDGEAYDRLGIETQYTEILDVKVPSITIPITPGRNLAVIFEVAAINNRQKRMGYNAAMEFTEQMSKFFANKDD